MLLYCTAGRAPNHVENRRQTKQKITIAQPSDRLMVIFTVAFFVAEITLADLIRVALHVQRKQEPYTMKKGFCQMYLAPGQAIHFWPNLHYFCAARNAFKAFWEAFISIGMSPDQVMTRIPFAIQSFNWSTLPVWIPAATPCF